MIDRQDLIRRVEVLEAKDEIRRLMAAYVYARDVANDPFAVADLFTADGVWEGTGHLAQTLGRHQGPAAIAERFSGPIPPGLHLLANESSMVEGDDARGSWSSLQPAVVQGRAFWLAARYDNDFHRQNGAWRFRHVRIDGVFEAPYDEGWAHTSFFTRAAPLSKGPIQKSAR